ncbi:hypothetical protein TESG_08528 [Trichophyton tonsurans CBS 112818]|uniref:Uncharacterized protein n=1 Tax=Trichophyton tonsurans (strain CBS 112818) TaxID=647933 RepID=F2S3D8_TRIT1|nr:hypothetical protein TESG_08528 [Trichophyton tonsurans CBS 112818]
MSLADQLSVNDDYVTRRSGMESARYIHVPGSLYQVLFIMHLMTWLFLLPSQQKPTNNSVEACQKCRDDLVSGIRTDGGTRTANSLCREQGEPAVLFNGWTRRGRQADRGREGEGGEDDTPAFVPL